MPATAASIASINPTVRERLLDAGERLFAEHGWNAVGIRTIAAEADVSLAALNYHFGEKEKLLAEIFAARAVPIVDERMRLLKELQEENRVTLESVIEAFLRPALTADTDHRFGGRTFVKLRARLAVEPKAFSRRILASAFDDSGKRYIAALQALLPDLPAIDLAWRFHFLLGTMVYTMVDPGRIQSMTGGLCDPGDVDTALQNIVPFLAAGFRSAPLVSLSQRPRHRRRNTTSRVDVEKDTESRHEKTSDPIGSGKSTGRSGIQSGKSGTARRSRD